MEEAERALAYVVDGFWVKWLLKLEENIKQRRKSTIKEKSLKKRKIEIQMRIFKVFILKQLMIPVCFEYIKKVHRNCYMEVFTTLER